MEDIEFRKLMEEIEFRKLSDEELDKMSEGQKLDYYLELLEIAKQQNTEQAEKLDEAINLGLVDRARKILSRFAEEWPGMVWDAMLAVLRYYGFPV
jgi:hypothetical protein